MTGFRFPKSSIFLCRRRGNTNLYVRNWKRYLHTSADRRYDMTEFADLNQLVVPKLLRKLLYSWLICYASYSSFVSSIKGLDKMSSKFERTKNENVVLVRISWIISKLSVVWNEKKEEEYKQIWPKRLRYFLL